MTRLLSAFVLVTSLGCASSADGRFATPSAPRDVPPGVNPDGDDPFRPSDAGPILVDGSTDVEDWTLPDGSVFDQRQAYFWVGAYRTNTISEGAYASAEFRLVPRPEDPRCMYVSAGNWDLVTCSTDGAGPDDNHPRPFPHGGAVTVRGGSENVSLNPNSAGQYMYFYESRPVFDGPRTVEVRAMGSPMVPMFSIMVEVPAALEITSPAVSPSGTVDISRSQDLVVTWRPIAARSVNVQVSATGTLAGRRTNMYVYADMPAGVGRGVIPARAMMSFAALTEVDSFTFRASPQNLHTQRVGAWPVQITSSGRSVNATVTAL